ncbi:MAG: RluA family pseudouridine synthase [Clostridia bacterium]|nr:RluA family pseudouridine synthase [Clostridia bacterium]
MSKTFLFTADENRAEHRLDVVVASYFSDVTRSRAQQLIAAGDVSVNGKAQTKNYKVKAGDRISVNTPEPKPVETEPEDIPLDIRYEDEDLLVVNKPKGMVVHPAAGHESGTLVNALLYHCGKSLSGINGELRPGIVHRIDKDTSGLLVVAKNDFAHNSLARQIKNHSFTREYEAVVYGNLKNDEGTIDAPIGRHPTQRKKQAVTDMHSRHAVTHYEVIARFEGFTHVRLHLETGRTHQIRVHMAHIGHPVAGDAVYGPKKVITALGGQCLHARLLGFDHPRSGRYVEVESELPEYFEMFLKKLKKV